MIFGLSYFVKLIYTILLYHLRILLKQVPLVCPPLTTNRQRNSPEDNESLQAKYSHHIIIGNLSADILIAIPIH